MVFEAITTGATYKLLIDDTPIFVTINQNEVGKIIELFAHTDSIEYFEIINLITRLVSIALRADVEPQEIAEELQNVYSMTSQHIIPGTTKLCPSIIARIGLCLKQHIDSLQNN